MTFRPLLASKAKLDLIRYPALASPKIDGIRCLTLKGQAVSRKLKPIPNLYVQEKMKALPNHLDGELVTFDDDTRPTLKAPVDDFNTIQSKNKSREGEPNFSYMVFDYFAIADTPYAVRMEYAKFASEQAPDWCSFVEYKWIDSETALMAYEQVCLMQRWEGVMLRDPEAAYKYGRSTAKEGILLKLKRFDDMECEVVGYTELMRNVNEAKEDALGRTERSSAKDGLVPAGVLGALVCAIYMDCNDNHHVETFEVGSGFDAQQRQELWERREQLKGKLITVKHQGFGSQGKPRFPVFKGFRHKDDT